MKVKSEEQILAAIEAARKHGEIAFASDNPKGDQQKIHRVLNKIKDENPLPMFPGEDEFSTHLHGGDKVIIRRKQANDLLFVPTPQETKTEQQPKLKRKKEPLWMIKWKETIARAEENPLFIKGNPECYDSWRYFDAVKTAMELWTEGDQELEEALRGSYELFHKHLASAFGYEVEEPELAESTLQERIIRLVQVLGELDPKDPDYNRVLNEKDRLVKLRDEEQWKPGADLLG